MIKLVYIGRKRDDVSSKDFYDYWLNKHGPLVRKVASALRARKYVQSHTIAPEVGAQLAQSRGMGEGYDGFGVLHMRYDRRSGKLVLPGSTASRALFGPVYS